MADNIPQEIIEQIFSNLPAKSVGKYRCLSKFWSTYLSSTEYTNLHLRNRRKTHNQGNNNIIVIARDRSLYIITPTLKKGEVSKQIRLPNTEWASVHGSCNGYVLVRNTCGNLFLLNPITLHQLKIPNLPCNEFGGIFDLGFRRTEYIDMFGLGYDLSRDDYKVVKFTCSYYENDFINDFHRFYIQPYIYGPLHKKIEYIHVYSVRIGAWKKVVVNNNYYPCVGLPPFSRYDFERCMAFVNGALHWLVKSWGDTLIIVAFDLESEVFREIPLSTDCCNVKKGCLCVLGGCLCIVADASINGTGTTTDVWMMKQYGVVDSWTKYRINTNKDEVHIYPLCYVNDDEFLNMRGANWVMYNVKQQTANTKHVGGDLGYICGASVFVDSLVSLDQLVVSR